MSVLEQTYMPAELDAELVAALESDATDHGERFYLDVAGESRVALPSSLTSMLRQAVQAMSEGLAVTIRPQTRQLSTTQVAELLGVTRSTVVKLLESGAIPYTKIGTHRRVDLPDALRYRDSRREAQFQFIADTAVGDEQPREELLEEMRAIRAKVAQQRKAARA